MPAFDPTSDQPHREHQAWRAFVREFQKLNPKIDFDSDEMLPFVHSVRLWGEELACLRAEGDTDQSQKALEYARSIYDPEATIAKADAGGAFGGGKTDGS